MNLSGQTVRERLYRVGNPALMAGWVSVPRAVDFPSVWSGCGVNTLDPQTTPSCTRALDAPHRCPTALDHPSQRVQRGRARRRGRGPADEDRRWRRQAHPARGGRPLALRRPPGRLLRPAAPRDRAADVRGARSAHRHRHRQEPGRPDHARLRRGDDRSGGGGAHAAQGEESGIVRLHHGQAVLADAGRGLQRAAPAHGCVGLRFDQDLLHLLRPGVAGPGRVQHRPGPGVGDPRAARGAAPEPGPHGHRHAVGAHRRG